MPSPENPNFSEDRLPWLQFELETELEMIEEGSTPDSVAEARTLVARVAKYTQEFWTQVGNEILARYGISEHDQLPAAGIIEYAEAHNAWIKDHPLHDEEA